MKKCPPGVICIQNVSMFFLLIGIIIVFYIIYTANTNKSNTEEKIIINERRDTASPNFFTRYNYGYTNLDNDVLLNPYVPPLKDERYLVPNISVVPRGTIPINISTNVGAVDTNYRQMGILTPLNGTTKDNILPLMGRPLFTNRQKFQYYTTSNQMNNVKLPVSVKGRSGTNEYGVDEIYTGDTVYVEGANQPFKVTMYENDTIKYLPAI